MPEDRAAAEAGPVHPAEGAGAESVASETGITEPAIANANIGNPSSGICSECDQATSSFLGVTEASVDGPTPSHISHSAQPTVGSSSNTIIAPANAAIVAPADIEVQVVPMTGPAVSGLAMASNLAAGVLGVARSLLSLGTSMGSPSGAFASDDDSEPCPICMDRPPTFAPSACGHALCDSCAVSYLRDQLGNAQAAVFAQGVRCCMHSAGCEAFITPFDAPRLLSAADAKLYREYEMHGEPPPGVGSRHAPSGGEGWTGGWTRLVRQAERAIAPRLPAVWAFFTGTGLLPPPLESGSSDSTITFSELRRLTRFCIEKAIPEESSPHVDCPHCGLLLLLPDEKARQRLREKRRSKRLGQLVVALERWRRQLRPCGCGGSLSDDIAQCPWCHYRWDLHAQSQASYADRATLAYIQLTTRKCPNPQCGERVSHFHGHGCHHISPMSDGCPSCHTHFCYICGRAHGRPGGGYERHHRCRHGSSYCSNEAIGEHLVMLPVPHDRRCGCVICSHCRCGSDGRPRPCSQCDGQCVVCKGLVAPGPNELPPEAVRAVLRRQRPCLVM